MFRVYCDEFDADMNVCQTLVGVGGSGGGVSALSSASSIASGEQSDPNNLDSRISNMEANLKNIKMELRMMPPSERKKCKEDVTKRTKQMESLRLKVLTHSVSTVF